MTDFDWKQLLNPKFYIELKFSGIEIGLYVVLFIVFAETGLLAGFFLPGDSLLFLCGIYSQLLMKELSTGSDFLNVSFLAALVSVMGILGNMVGYWFGKKSGNYLFKREDSFFFKKKYLFQSKDFFDKYGTKAIVFARFLPVVRTFAPVVAGIVEMERKKFMFYNILGSLLWSFTLIFAGHYLYELFLTQFKIDLKHYIEFIVIGIIAVTTLPVLWKIFKKRAHIE